MALSGIAHDLGGNTLSVTDIQIGATSPGATGLYYISSVLGSTGVAFSTTSTISTTSGVVAGGTITALSGVSITTSGGVTTPAVIFGASGPGIYVGSSAPTISATRGSMYMRTDTSFTASTYLYVNTTGVSTWTAVL